MRSSTVKKAVARKAATKKATAAKKKISAKKTVAARKVTLAKKKAATKKATAARKAAAVAKKAAAKKVADRKADPDDDAEDSDYENGADEGFEVEKEGAPGYDYGDLNEEGGLYKVQYTCGVEITLEEHQRRCGCNLDVDESDHRLVVAGSAANIIA